VVRRIRRSYRNPLWRRRFGCALIVVSALLAGTASRWAGGWGWLGALPPLIAGVWVEARTSDGLFTVRYPGGKRRSVTLACSGLIALVGGLIVRSMIPAGIGAALVVAGAGFLGAGGGALAWHYAATYAGDRIVKLSDEDW